MPSLGSTTPFYGGSQLPNPCQVIINDLPPPVYVDSGKLIGGTFYLNTTNTHFYVLSHRGAGGAATWMLLSSGTPGGVMTVTGDSGGAISPDSFYNLNLIGGLGATVVGNASSHTLTIDASGSITSPLPIIQGGTNATSMSNADGVVYFDGTLLNTTAVGTSDFVLTSNGSGSAPSFKTIPAMTSPLPVIQGGTGVTSTTSYGVICGGVSSTSPFQNAGAGIAGYFLQSNGAGSLPGWTAVSPAAGFTVINIQTITSNAVYIPSPGMMYCEVKILGGGGAGGGSFTTTPGVSGSVGGSAGEYAVGVFDSATIGSSKNVIIGVGGTGTANTSGGNGTTTSFGTLMTANGGGGGGITGILSASAFLNGSPGGTGGTGGSYRIPGARAPWGGVLIDLSVPIQLSLTSGGADSQLGAGGNPGVVTSPENGLGYGSGGGGAGSSNSAGQAGGNGAPGVAIITEYI